MFKFSGFIDDKHMKQSEVTIPMTNGNFHFDPGSAVVAKASNEDTTMFLASTFFQYKSASGDEALAHLLKDFSTEGKAAISNLYGQFLLIIIQHKTSKVLFASDKIGSVPLYYHQTNGRLFFASHLKSLVDLLPDKPTISNQAIYNYVFHHCIPAPFTVYEGVNKLSCAELLEFKSNTISKDTYYVPTFSQSDVDVKDYSKRLFNSLESSVKDRVSGLSANSVGAFLSGGLDSSTVSGMLSKSFPDEQANTFTIGFNAEGYDESGYAKIVADHFKTKHHVYYVTPEDVVSSLPEIAAYYDEPFGNSSALPAYHCAKYAHEQGVRVMLAGDGGDEFFAGNERYAKQKVFELYYKIPAPLRKLLLEIPLDKVSEEHPITLLRKAASYVRQAKIGLPNRLYTYNFLHRIDPQSVFNESLLQAVNQQTPLNEINKRYNLPKDADSLSRMLFLDWKFTLADNDLVKVTNMCHKAGIDVRYPMLDDRLIDLSTKIPSNVKLPGHQLRHFYKETTKGFLPDATINKSKQGFGLPFGHWLSTNKQLKDMAYENVLGLSSAGFFKKEFLQNAIKLHQQGDANSYYGELIWILSMLNMWIITH
jgi:asparagine synthase (glutamine-hydrolysing)